MIFWTLFLCSSRKVT